MANRVVRNRSMARRAYQNSRDDPTQAQSSDRRAIFDGELSVEVRAPIAVNLGMRALFVRLMPNPRPKIEQDFSYSAPHLAEAARARVSASNIPPISGFGSTFVPA
jgi:hypothetical protein